MSRLIDADALLKRNCGNLVDGIYYTSCEECQADGEVCGLEIDAEEIRNAPTVDAIPLEDYKSMERTVNKLAKAIAEAEPIKHGHWEDEQRGRWIYARCGLCGTVHNVRTNYCPNCGADMRGGR